MFAVVRRLAPSLSAVLIFAAFVPGIFQPVAEQALAATTPTLVQVAAAKAISGTTVRATFANANTSGNTLVAFVVWSNTAAISLSDSAGDTYTAAGSATPWRGGSWTAQVFYATNISGGTNTTTVTFASALAGSGLLYVHEYAGIDPVSPLDAAQSASGTSASMDSGGMATANAADLLFGAGASNNTITAPSPGYASRATGWGNLTEDASVTATGAYHATASQNGTFWVMYLVAFRASGTSPGPTPSSTSTSTSATSTATATGPTLTPTPTPTGSAAITAPLRVSQTNSHYFIDGNGRAVVLSGSHTWDDFQDTDQSNQPAAFDFTGYVNFLQAHGHNMTILWKKDLPTYCNWGAGGTWQMAQFPWPRSGAGNASDGKPKFDLSRFDQTYFDRLRVRVLQLQANNIYATVQLFDGLGLLNNRCASDGYPLTGSNNVNAIDDGGSANSMTMNAPNAITAIQDAYVRKVVDTVNDLPNVLWEVSEEAPSNSTWWQNHMIALVHQYEAGKPSQHVVGYPFLTGGSDSTLYSSAAEWVAPGAKLSPTNNQGKVVINDSDHSYFGLWNDSAQVNRNYIWQNFANGSSVIFMDPYVVEWLSGNRNRCPNATNGVCTGVDLRYTNLRDNLGYTVQYATRMNLLAMTPQGGRASTGYALANTSATGSEYLIYAPNGGSFTVDLSNTNRMFNVEWLNPVTGNRTAAASVAGGSSAQGFNPPFSGDAVLYLVDAASAAPTSTPTPSSTPTATNTAVVANTATPTNTAVVVGNTATPTSTAIVVNTSTPTPTLTPTPTVVIPPTVGPSKSSPPTFVQINSTTPQSPQSTVNVRFGQAQAAGDTNVVVIGWNDATANVLGVVDSAGNSYRVAAPTARGQRLSQAIYYASNIKAAAAGTNPITVTFNAAVSYPDIRILEYGGLDATSPFDGSASASGNSQMASSGSVATTAPNELIVGAGTTNGGFGGSGASFQTRIITNPDGDIAQDRTVMTNGSYTASAAVNDVWVMQAAAFRAATH